MKWITVGKTLSLVLGKDCVLAVVFSWQGISLSAFLHLGLIELNYKNNNAKTASTSIYLY